MAKTTIEWTDRVWNPLRGCSRVSEGCRNCYAERLAARFSKPGGPAIGGGSYPAQAFHGLAEMTEAGPRWTGKVGFVEENLHEPLHWRRPQRVFVNSMSDLFHESVPDAWLDKIWGVMSMARQHTFQVLTKRPERMLAYFTRNSDAFKAIPGAWSFPLPNLWLGVSVESQETADDRIPPLLRTPAAVRWISAEPLLGPLDLRTCGLWSDMNGIIAETPPFNVGLDWVVVGGESGPGARPFAAEWARNIVGQCRDARVPAFVKQLGAYPLLDSRYNRTLRGARRLRDKKGGDMSEWPEDLRVREIPR